MPTPSIDALLTESVERWNLLNHPFYKSWSAGTLPVEALATYAREYGAFIGLLPLGWDTQEDAETADEEREHAELWGDFAGALHTIVGVPATPETQALCDTARTLFAEPATAMGALYAFEAQQPPTATSKLDGLRQHYTLGRKAEVYFQKHTANHHEAQKLLTRIESLSSADQQHART
ncbi:MAG: iron-containing redox enzyme family protein, partial [Gemmatimonadales bacterium]